MMQITVLQENLQTSLNYLQKVIPSKPQLPILSSILLSVGEQQCTLAATDLYMGIRSTIPVTSDSVGEIVVPGKQFKEIISSLSAGEVTLSYSENTLTISTKQTTATLQCYPSDEYPPFPQVEGQQFSLSKEQLGLIEKYVAFSASSDQTRPVLTTVLFQSTTEGMRAVATDGFRLALLTFAKGWGEGESLLIPSRALVEVYRIVDQLGEEQLDFTVSEELKQILFVISEVEVFVRLIEGEYPPYERILPSLFETEVMFEKAELVEHIKRALIFARESSNITQLIIEEGVVKITASSPSLGTFEGVLQQAEVSGGSAEIAFNSRYLLDFLAAIDSDRIWFGMSDSLKPALFRSEDLEQYQYVVMPFKVNR